MCRLIHYYVCISSSFSFYGAYCTALYSFSFNELVHELIFERVLDLTVLNDAKYIAAPGYIVR